MALFFGLHLSGCEGSDPVEQHTGRVQVNQVNWSLNETYQSLVSVTWNQSVNANAWVEFSVDEEIWHQSPIVKTSQGMGEALLLGVPYDWEVEFQVVVKRDGTETRSDLYTATTGVLPSGITSVVKLPEVPSEWSPDLNYILASVQLGEWVVILDREARIVWAQSAPFGTRHLHPRVSQDGLDILIDYNTYWGAFDGGQGSHVIRMKIDGSQSEVIPTPFLYHAYTDLADGTLAWPGYPISEFVGPGADTVLMVRRPQEESTVWVWRCRVFADSVNMPGMCGANTLWWNEDTDTFFISLWSYETIVEVDHQTGRTLRHFGHAIDAWAFDPPESAFWWQHGVNILDNGNMLTSSQQAPMGAPNSSELLVKEYEMNYDTQTLTRVWAFGFGEGVRSTQMGEAHRLINGNTLHNYGDGERLREVTPDREVVWDLDFRDYLGRTTPIEDLYELAP